MATAQPRVLEFEVSVDRDLTARSGRGGSEIQVEAAWSAEHLLLAALLRCTLTSLDYHVRRAGLTVAGSGHAHGTVTRRGTDDRYAFVDVEATYDVEIESPLDQQAMQKLLASAERGCFVGNSLTATPRYHWTVNGEDVR